ncbi:hypothetical protein BC939DRAFT_480974 [Gamsiella multidivaricata]|uniref:uncharacterized protein n=1 Tax=Gamsiella multidivaricata TaxID=101098 RepID=UPI002220AA4D|nr:uncharacterized protein BC939DRAFT_480974 [Gamsiella multidivaricata]KAI7817664.1 hypothetical protein BC939DRAFT_480974 [Gamsiella multidivaricata]
MVRIHMLALALVLVLAFTVSGAPVQLKFTPVDKQEILSSEVSIDGNLIATGRIITYEYLQILGIANEAQDCFPKGLIGQDINGRILSCREGSWQTFGISTITRYASHKAYRFPSAYVLCAPHERVVGGGGACSQPSGHSWLLASKPVDNGWGIQCDGGLRNEWGSAEVWAICAW